MSRFDNLAAWAPSADAVLYASRSAQLTTDGIFRQDTSGTAYGPVTPIGDLPRLPVSGLENRKVELYLKDTRGDLDQLPDSGIDDMSARVFYRPCWLNTPGS